MTASSATSIIEGTDESHKTIALFGVLILYEILTIYM